MSATDLAALRLALADVERRIGAIELSVVMAPRYQPWALLWRRRTVGRLMARAARLRARIREEERNG